MPKHFKLDPSQIQTLAFGHGSCIASDLITVEGKPVGYLYRDVNDDKQDSGWRFFAGTESEDYTNDPANFEIYDVNTIANYDPAIIPILDAAQGTAWGRDENDRFVQEANPIDPEV